MKLSQQQQIYNNINMSLDNLESDFFDHIDAIINNIDSIILDANSYKEGTNNRMITKSFEGYKALWEAYNHKFKPCAYSHECLREILNYIYLGGYKQDEKKRSIFLEGTFDDWITKEAKDAILVSLDLYKTIDRIFSSTEKMFELKESEMEFPHRNTLHDLTGRQIGISKKDWKQHQQRQEN